MRIFLDSSALAKRYIAEKGSQKVISLCKKADEIILSILCIPEILSAFNRLRRERKMSDQQYQKLKSDLFKDITQATIVGIDNPVIMRTTICLEQEIFRTLDAIHIASAKESICDLFVSSDQKQCKAASGLGFQTKLI